MGIFQLPLMAPGLTMLSKPYTKPSRDTYLLLQPPLQAQVMLQHTKDRAAKEREVAHEKCNDNLRYSKHREKQGSSMFSGTS